MRIAAIDIGTNSVHMIVVRLRPDFSYEIIDREKEMVRLGAGGLDGRKLTPEAMASALAARDRSDTTRAASPLALAADAVLIDTTGLPIDEVVDRVMALVQKC